MTTPLVRLAKIRTDAMLKAVEELENALEGLGIQDVTVLLTDAQLDKLRSKFNEVYTPNPKECGHTSFIRLYNTSFRARND